MIFQCMSAIVLGSILSLFFGSLLAFSLDIHLTCLSLIPLSDYQEFYSALTCGLRPAASIELLNIKRLGLIHILVVSGAHLVLLSKIIDRFSSERCPFLIESFLLLLFVAACQFQNAATRAWLMHLMVHLNTKLKLNNPPALNLLVSVLFCFCLSSKNFSSLSLVLSWLACLGVMSAKSTFAQSFFCYLYLFPALLKIQVQSAWTIAINGVLTPIIAGILFPLSFFTIFFPDLTKLGDFLWRELFTFSSFMAPQIKSNQVSQVEIPQLFLWLIPLTINLVFIYKQRRKNEILVHS